MNKEDYLKALRGLLREIVRTLRYDFPFITFCTSLMSDWSAHCVYATLDSGLKERVLNSITDLVALCELMTISPAVREAATTGTSWSDKRKGLLQLRSFTEFEFMPF